MSENSPAPTPARGVYGFALYLASTSALFIYLVWAFVPDSILHSVGITYYPQKYWAIALPIYALMALALFAFCIYPSLNALLTPPLDSISTLTDKFSLHQEYQHSVGPHGEGVLPAGDLDISLVCRTLYINNEADD